MAQPAAVVPDRGCVSGLVSKTLGGQECRVQVLSITTMSDGAVAFDISDTEKSIRATLSAELAKQYNGNQLPVKKNSIIKLTGFHVSKDSQNGHQCVISGMSTLAHANGILGQPIKLGASGNGNGSGAAQGPQPPNQTFNAKANKSIHNNRNQIGASNGKGISTRCQPISSLNPYQSGWRVKVRVTQKGTMRTYMRDGRENVVFSVNLLDSEGTEIQATMFNNAGKKFYPKIEEGSIYYIGNGRVTIARQRYTHIKNDYAITLNENSEVTLAPTDSNDGNGAGNDTILAQVYHFTKIENIGKCAQGAFVDVCGIVSDVKEMTQVISRNTGKELQRRNISVCDQTCKLIDLTIWGKMAQEYDSDKLGNNPVVVMKAVRVSEYAGGKQLTCNNNILINPFESVKEAKQLHHWWGNEGGSTKKFEPLAAAVGSAGASKIPRYSISEVKDFRIGFEDDSATSLNFNTAAGAMMTPTKATLMNMNKNGNANKPKYFTMVGTITRTFQVTQNENTNDRGPRLPWYKACTDPKMNNAKVTETTDGRYHCAKNGSFYDNYTPRYVTRFAVCDENGQMWLNAFNDQATMILGTDCQTVETLYNNGDFDSVNRVFKAADFKKYVFRVRAKSQEYNGEQRVRFDLVTVQPIQFGQEASVLAAKIEKLQASLQQTPNAQETTQ